MSAKPLNLVDQIRRYARDCGMSQNALARATNIEPCAINRFILGKRGLSMERLSDLAAVLRLRLVVDESEETK